MKTPCWALQHSETDPSEDPHAQLARSFARQCQAQPQSEDEDWQQEVLKSSHQLVEVA